MSTRHLKEIQAQALLQAKCYNLPYGVIGFISHLLTYYTLFMLWLGYRPMAPWKPLKYKAPSLALTFVQFISTATITGLVIKNCHGEQQFELIAAWMLMTSTVLSIMTTAAPYCWGENCSPKGDESGQAVLLLAGLIWLAGCIMGVVGVLQFTSGKWEGIKGLDDVTAVFGVMTLWPILYVGIMIWAKQPIPAATWWLLIRIQMILISALGLLWMDWTRGVVTGNLVGASQDGAGIYWTYFIMKRLPMLSF